MLDDDLTKALTAKAHRDIKKLNNVDMADLIQRLEIAESKFSTISSLENQVSELQTKLLNYETHTHNYSDNDGAVDTTRTTGGVN